MSQPLYIPVLTEEDRQQLEAARKSQDLFAVRRAQIILASAAGHTSSAIAELVGCSDQTVRNTIRAFSQQGLACLHKQPVVFKTERALLPKSEHDRVRALLHQSPRAFGKNQSVWTLDLLAEVCEDQGISKTRLSKHVMRLVVQRLGANWKRAKHWITSPDPAYGRKKSDATV